MIAVEHRLRRHGTLNEMMEERAWIRRNDVRMRFLARRTSRDRCWTGFSATLYEASAGYSEDSFTDHSVSMHVGAPLMLTRFRG